MARTCFYTLAGTEYEKSIEYILYNDDCPSEEEFRHDVVESIRSILNDLLKKDVYIGIDDIYESIIPLLEKKGYKRVEYDGIFLLTSTVLGIFVCNKNNMKLLGKDICKSIEEHNKTIDKRILEEITGKTK